MNLSEKIKQKAHELGFDLVGITPVKPVPDFDFFRWWLGQGFAGMMNYLHRGLEKRGDPEKILPGARSIICCGLNYDSGQIRSISPEGVVRRKGDPHRTAPLPMAGGEPLGDDGEIGPAPATGDSMAWISSYAWGEDYHEVIGEKLEQLEIFIQQEIDSSAKTKSYVDTGPILERSYAARAGLGWIGKNTCLINNGVGSFLFLGEVLTTIPLRYDQPALDQCGSCTKCLEVCPTKALTEPYVMDATKCISYLTIEHKGEFSEEQGQRVGNHLYGCDICQEVCPYNERNSKSSVPEFYPRKEFVAPHLKEIESIREEEFQKIRHGSAMKRIKWKQWVRNLRAILKNQSSTDRK
ncbi:MAG: tRNA epoxyqueuosine(34) reductase QueG [Deltaproteobacteria bacterium]|nr:tRNA epoxyqueuosine(34) reductase QueG [Deltaproteobacteria bacterium]MBI2500164.1 tRNA epoxyqueuosine(34) reductase QueG [Deltaproteobacteria bacterium]